MKLRSDLTLRQMGDDHIIVEPHQGMVDLSKVYTLNKSAAFLWKSLNGYEFEQGDVVRVLTENYEVNDVQAKHDAAEMIQYFRSHGLLTD